MNKIPSPATVGKLVVSKSSAGVRVARRQPTGSNYTPKAARGVPQRAFETGNNRAAQEKTSPYPEAPRQYITASRADRRAGAKT